MPCPAVMAQSEHDAPLQPQFPSIAWLCFWCCMARLSMHSAMHVMLFIHPTHAQMPIDMLKRSRSDDARSNLSLTWWCAVASFIVKTKFQWPNEMIGPWVTELFYQIIGFQCSFALVWWNHVYLYFKSLGVRVSPHIMMNGKQLILRLQTIWLQNSCMCMSSCNSLAAHRSHEFSAEQAS